MTIQHLINNVKITLCKKLVLFVTFSALECQPKSLNIVINLCFYTIISEAWPPETLVAFSLFTILILVSFVVQ